MTTAANDSAPTRADDFPDLAARRAWVASLKLPARDSDIPHVVGCPTLVRLSNSGKRAHAAALVWWARAFQPLEVPGGVAAANDNRPTDEGWERAEWALPAQAGDSLAVDRLLDIRPTINELISAVGRVSVCTRRTSNGWGAMERRPNQLVVGKHKGGADSVWRHEIVGWFDGNGVERRARVTLAGPKGGYRKSRSTADIRRYLDRPGCPFPVHVMAYDGGRGCERTEAAIEAHRTLAALGVDGSVPSDRLPYPVKKLETVVATGVHWFGGIVARTGGSSGSLDATAVEGELARTGTARLVRNKVGEGVAKLLDLATTRLTAAEIGHEFGYVNKHAERWAVREIDRALEKIAA